MIRELVDIKSKLVDTNSNQELINSIIYLRPISDLNMPQII